MENTDPATYCADFDEEVGDGEEVATSEEAGTEVKAAAKPEPATGDEAGATVSDLWAPAEPVAEPWHPEPELVTELLASNGAPRRRRLHPRSAHGKRASHLQLVQHPLHMPPTILRSHPAFLQPKPHHARHPRPLPGVRRDNLLGAQRGLRTEQPHQHPLLGRGQRDIVAGGAGGEAATVVFTAVGEIGH